VREYRDKEWGLGAGEEVVWRGNVGVEVEKRREVELDLGLWEAMVGAMDVWLEWRLYGRVVLVGRGAVEEVQDDSSLCFGDGLDRENGMLVGELEREEGGVEEGDEVRDCGEGKS
jgi:hypothetical protein